MLLDTHVLIWLLEGDERLGVEARASMARVTDVHVSAASLWEIAIKVELGRLQAPDDLPDVVQRAGLQHLSVTAEHAWSVQQVAGLPHRDPFDRLLVAQAAVEGLTLLTADRALLAASARLQPAVRLLDARR